MKRTLGLIFAFVFLDLLGYSLILPLLPYYAETFGASLTLVGLLGTSNALAQLFATPFIGRLSDRYGRRPLLLVSIAGTFIAFMMLALARSLPMLFASRIVDGLLGGNIALARAYITDVTDEKSRARGLGLIGAAFGMGFIIGPAMGGFLSRYGYNIPAFVAAGLSLLNFLAVFAWVPESLTPEHRAAIQQKHPTTRISARALWNALQHPCMGPILHVILIYALAFTLFQSNFALYAKTRFNLAAQNTAYVLTYVGILAVLVQGVAIGRLTARFSEKQLLFASAALLSLALLAWGFAPNVPALLGVLAPVALSAGVLNVVSSSLLTKSVYRTEVGGTLGLAASFQTLAQIITPASGGFLLDYFGTWTLGVVGAVLMAWTAWFIYRHILHVPDEMMAGCSRLAEVSAQA